MPSIPEIQGYFDRMSVGRDLALEGDPILGYEQSARQRAVMEMIDLRDSHLVLDVGCGNARDVSIFVEATRSVVGLDLSGKMLDEGLKKLGPEGRASSGFVRGTAVNLPFIGESFDRVSCSETIEHVPAWTKALEEAVRVLKKGGRIVVTTPNRLSMYGFLRPISKLVSHTLNRLGRVASHDHPYDEWKVQEEVVAELQALGVTVDRRIGVCFVPSHATYLLPRQAKQRLVRLVSKLESQFRYRLHPLGYILGISGVKTS